MVNSQYIPHLIVTHTFKSSNHLRNPVFCLFRGNLALKEEILSLQDEVTRLVQLYITPLIPQLVFSLTVVRFYQNSSTLFAIPLAQGIN